MNHDTTSCGRAHDHPGGSLLLSNSMVNSVKGVVVQSRHVSLPQPTVRIRAGRPVDLRISLPMGNERCFFPGQPVIAKIPAEAVRLEAGLFRRSNQRPNCWYGRIVLIKSLEEGQIITAKVHDAGVKNDLNRKTILVTGSDCYRQAFAMGELVPAIGG